MSKKENDFGKVFYRRTYKQVFDDACTRCGRVRNKGDSDYSFDSEQYCGGCGRSYSNRESCAVKVYVIGVYEQFDGKKGYQLSETSPEEYTNNMHNGKGVSYWNSSVDELGSSFFETEKEVV